MAASEIPALQPWLFVFNEMQDVSSFGVRFNGLAD
jgi:hypothetical protein